MLSVAAAIVLAAGSASAQNQVNTCGQTLAQPGVYVLATDLDCSGTFANGINITASNVTFHLGNHTLSSTDCDMRREIYGIFVPRDVSNVKIDGGIVRGFVDGVVLFSSKSHVSAMTVTGACLFGIAVQNDGNSVTTNRVNHVSGYGIGLQVATNTHITANDISNNVCGVGLSNHANHNFITYNILSGNGAGSGCGVRVNFGTDNIVANNAFDGNFSGILLEDAGNTARDNTIRGSVNSGIAVSSNGSPGNVIHNTVLGSGVADMSDASPSCGANTWTRNTFDTDLVNGVPDGGPHAGCIR
jgi:parallel beta-helix repeat protein